MSRTALSSLPARLLALAFLALSGCGVVDAAVDCEKICRRYSDCYDAAYDFSACAERCRANSDAEVEYRQKANMCEACIDDRACASATFSCGSDCLTVVP